MFVWSEQEIFGNLQDMNLPAIKHLLKLFTEEKM